ncbi:hypothetical protein, partial [Streptomyces sp. A 4/2]|uniref:hypothetical protein n=1 Tax=Streptomyces sp. A 4/2 TaxID=2934314 RepID=UPI0020249875
VTLLNIGITAGESTHADTLSKSALPHRVQARITEDSGKVDILLHGDKVDAFSAVTHKDKAYAYGVRLVAKLQKLIPR